MLFEGSGTFTSLTPLSMQDMKLNATATLIEQSMSPYHAGEPRDFVAIGFEKCTDFLRDATAHERFLAQLFFT